MNKEVVFKFINYINHKEIRKILSLITEDHVLIDSWDNKVDIKNIEIAWKNYFELFPDYLIKIEEVYEVENKVIVFGKASGTYFKTDGNSNYWCVPACWKAIVKDNKIREWRVYSDAKKQLDATK